MRPTIPLAEWRLAIDLEATRAMTVEAAFPARGCGCDDCVQWAAIHGSALPASLLAELRRIGVDPSRPSEAYTLGRDDKGRTLRVTYHCVGRILSGPAEWAPTAERSKGRQYIAHPASTGRLALAVGYLESFQSIPAWAAAFGKPLIAIDLWLEVADGQIAQSPPARQAGG
jgi:hypothetical protein